MFVRPREEYVQNRIPEQKMAKYAIAMWVGSVEPAIQQLNDELTRKGVKYTDRRRPGYDVYEWSFREEFPNIAFPGVFLEHARGDNQSSVADAWVVWVNFTMRGDDFDAVKGVVEQALFPDSLA